MHVCAWMTVLALAALPAAAWPQACLYRGDSADTRVANRSGEITTPFPDVASALDCRRLRVATGAVTVYTLQQDRQAMAARRIEAGGGPLLPGRSADADDAAPGLLRQVMVVLEGAQRSRTGSSRGSSNDYLPAMLPTGLLGQPAQDLVIALGMPDMAFNNLELTVNGKPALRLRGPANEVRLPARLLVPGNQVAWKLNDAEQAYEGQFQVVTTDQLRTLVAQLDAGVVTDDETLRQLRIAAGLVHAGYAWDAREWLRQILLR